MNAPAIVHGVEVSWDRVSELFSLDPTVTYLNHGGFGAVPVPVQRAQQRLRDEMEANPTAFFVKGLTDRLRHVRQHLAGFLGADPDLSALVPNATAGAEIALRAIKAGPGDEIVTTNHGYATVDFSISRLSARTGVVAHATTVPLDATDDECVAAVVNAVTPGRTRLAIVDHVTSPTAKRLPVARIVAALRELNVPSLVDAAHAPGMLPVDVSAVGADFWVGNLHKWAFAPRPTALFVAAARQRDHIESLVVSHQHAVGYPESVEFGGTLDYTPWLAAPVGLHLLRTLGVEAVRAHNTQLAEYAQRAVAAAVRADPAELVGSPGVSMRLVPLPSGLADTPAAARELRDRLSTEHRCEVAINAWHGRAYLRVCAQIYNTEADADRLADVLSQLTGARRA